MKQWLIFGVSVAFAAIGNATPASASAPPVAQTKPPQQQQPVRASAQSTAVRHLSDEERAELRRQLQQFNQQYTRRQ